MSGSSVPGRQVGEKGKLTPENTEEELVHKLQRNVVRLLSSVDQRAPHPRTAPSSG